MRPELVHTAQLTAEDRAALGALMSTAFAGDFADEDLDHTLGGVHALLREDGQLIGHGAVVQRQLIAGGETLRAGYVEGLAVDPGHQRRGHGAALMGALEAVIDDAYDLGALSSTEDALAF